MVKRKTRNHKESSSAVNYRESSSDSDDVRSEDVLEWEDEEEASNHPVEPAASSSDSIERVLRQRDGVPGAVGSPTTWYNIQDKSDPMRELKVWTHLT
uniref:Uncharacterized protein n=1 Tax=Ditylenchus dipsaci TaxID=166011 RepID=A0A915DJG2_9BILA